MFETFKTIREAFEVPSWLFILISATFGFLLFGSIGWIIDRNYQKGMHRPMSVGTAESVVVPPLQPLTKAEPAPTKPERSGDKPVNERPPKRDRIINQTSNAPYSPNIVTGDQSPVTITNPLPNPYGATETWDYNGMRRRQSPGVMRGEVGDEAGAFETLRTLQSQGEWTALLQLSTQQIQKSPSWPTPYLFSAEAHAQLGDLDRAKQELAAVQQKVSNSPGYAGHIQRVERLIEEKESERP